MKFWKFLGGLMVFLGCLAALAGILATAVPLIDNEQLRRIVESFSAPTQDALIGTVNRVILFCLANHYLLFGVGAAVLLAGGLMKTAASKGLHRTAQQTEAGRNATLATHPTASAKPAAFSQAQTALSGNSQPHTASVSPYITAEYAAPQLTEQPQGKPAAIGEKYLPRSIVEMPADPPTPKPAYTPDLLTQRDSIARKTAELYGDGSLFATQTATQPPKKSTRDDEPIICKACGASNTSRSAFCDQCGSRLPADATPWTGAQAQVPSAATPQDAYPRETLQSHARQAMEQVRSQQSDAVAARADAPASVKEYAIPVPPNVVSQPLPQTSDAYLHFHAPDGDASSVGTSAWEPSPADRPSTSSASQNDMFVKGAPDDPFAAAQKPTQTAPRATAQWVGTDMGNGAVSYANAEPPAAAPVAEARAVPAYTSSPTQRVTGEAIRKPRVVIAMNRDAASSNPSRKPDSSASETSATPKETFAVPNTKNAAYSSAQSASAGWESAWSIDRAEYASDHIAVTPAASTPTLPYGDVPTHPTASAQTPAPFPPAVPAQPTATTPPPQASARPRIVSTMGKKSDR